MGENFEHLLESYIQKYIESERGKEFIESSMVTYMNQTCVSRLNSLRTCDYDPFNQFPHHGQQIQSLLDQCNTVKAKIEVAGTNIEHRQTLCDVVMAIYETCESLELLQAFGKDSECQLSQEVDRTIENNANLLLSISSIKPSMTREEFLALADEPALAQKPSMTREEFLALAVDSPTTPKATMTREEFLSLGNESFDVFSSTPPQRAEESKLRKYGYSVAQDNDMSEAERHELLRSLIVHNVVTKGYVISYLKHMIQINGKKEANYIALSKWTSDLDYVLSL